MSENKLPSWSCCIITLVCLGKKEGIAFSSSVVVLLLEVWLLWGRNLTLCHGPTLCGCTFTKIPVLRVEETVFSLCGPKSAKMNTPALKPTLKHKNSCTDIIYSQCRLNFFGWAFSTTKAPAAPVSVTNDLLEGGRTYWQKLLAVLLNASRKVIRSLWSECCQINTNSDREQNSQY